MTALAHPDIAQQLQANLQAQRDCAKKLLGIMQEERQALMASDVARLETITQSKSEAAGLLQTLGNTLLQLRKAAHAGSLDGWFVSLRNGLPALWDELLELAGKCRAANQDNAVLLGSREAQLKQTLRAFRPAGTPELYGRSGYAPLGLSARQFGAA
ncbi:flagella synthesis protein FlgN [Solimonas terrae]|uniref:Flagellar protein FlgN n=1 Tax=Solimonas terrae TaxID=1396819 RepID=A0A6M2BQQ4_9GAMM|nr:flagellar protein FlgN [Solimonas terrae]NGY04399.1 flagellar protein FlgN [Solimonas terrae]